MYWILRKVVEQWMGPAMEQCNEADMTIDQRDLKYIITSAVKRKQDQGDLKHPIPAPSVTKNGHGDIKNYDPGCPIQKCPKSNMS